MDLLALKAHEDKVLRLVEPLSRLEQLITLRYLRTCLGVSVDQTGNEIMKELRKETAAK